MIPKNLPKLSDLETLDKFEYFLSDQQVLNFCTLMQKGCVVKIHTGCTLSDLLCNQFQISTDCIKNEIKVIFLDKSPVDDLDSAIIKDGGVLALSAAMPGVVGAAMRRDGLSWMRNSITYHENDHKHEKQEGIVHVKLFNQVMVDLGESFLRRGVYINSLLFREFLEMIAWDLWKNSRKVLRNGKNITADAIARHNGCQLKYKNTKDLPSLQTWIML